MADLPPGFHAVAGEAPDAERSLLLLFSRVLKPSAMAALRELRAQSPDSVGAEFDALPADASEDVRQDLAERFAPIARRQRRDFPSLVDPASPQGEAVAMSVVVQGLVEVYNPAQLDVLPRLDALLEGQ